MQYAMQKYQYQMFKIEPVSEYDFILFVVTTYIIHSFCRKFHNTF